MSHTSEVKVYIYTNRLENGFINEFGIKVELKSFEERVLIFTTSIENLYIFKVTKHKGGCRNNQSQRSHSKMWIKIQWNR